MKTKSIALLTIVLALAGKAYPYSHDGHYLVGAIADQMLAGTPTARYFDCFERLLSAPNDR